MTPITLQRRLESLAHAAPRVWGEALCAIDSGWSVHAPNSGALKELALLALVSRLARGR